MRPAGLIVWLPLVAACLAAPPRGIAADGGGGDGDGGAGELVLTGMAARDPLTLDGRDEVAIVGSRGGEPVALVLFPGADELAEADVREVPLPFDPSDVEITRWGGQTGLVLALGPDAQLAAIDQEARLVSLSLEVAGAGPYTGDAYLVSEVNDGSDRHAFMADDAVVLASAPLGGGEPGDEPIELHSLADSGEPRILGASYDGVRAAVGVVGIDQEIDVFLFTGDPTPTVGADLVTGDLAPAGLFRWTWRSFSGGLVLIGIDEVGAVWWHRTDLEGETTTSGSVDLADVDVVHDVMITQVAPGPLDLAVLAEVGGALEVLVYLDPDIEVGLTDPLRLPISGLTLPVWLQAVDAVGEVETGINELLVYDAGGRVICVDVDAAPALLGCGEIDLSSD